MKAAVVEGGQARKSGRGCRMHACTEPDDFAERFGGRPYQPRHAAFGYGVPTALDGVVDKLRSLPPCCVDVDRGRQAGATG